MSSIQQRGDMSDISPDALESVWQFVDTWRTITMEYGPSDVHDLPGMDIRWADSKFRFWTVVPFTDQDTDSRLLDERLAEAAAHLRGKTQSGLSGRREESLGDMG
jgi:hypothetical protein